MASSCVACCIFHIISIPFDYSDTALRVAEAMIGAIGKIFVFRHVCLVSRIWRQNSIVGMIFGLFSLGSQAEISHINPRRNSARSTGFM